MTATAHTPTLADIGRVSLANSARWFPEVHERGPEAVLIHLALGIAGEAGEVVDVVKKVDICGVLDDTCEMHAPGKHSITTLGDEMADLLTYLVNLAALLDIDLVSVWQRKQAECERRWGNKTEAHQ